MIPANNIREVKADGVQNKGTFSISVKNAASIMVILRDTLYSDKELAVLREYAANAWDAHREVGKGDLPIKIHLPTHDDPVLTIRDFGPGLSEPAALELYTQYGESTKRESDLTVGCLGIGSKSGFAYSDSFTVTSWNGGTKSVYVAYLDPSDKGEINKIASEPCGDETGLEIRIAVRVKDIGSFEKKARELFKYFSPKPDINIELPELERSVTPHGFIIKDTSRSEREWVALMGCVPYRLDITQIETELTDLGLGETMSSVYGGLYFNIGEVQISASREELKYSDKTNAAVVKKMQLLLESYVEDTFLTLKSTHASGLQKRLKTRFLTTILRLPIPKSYKAYAAGEVELYDSKTPPSTFHLLNNTGYSTTSIPVRENVKVFFRDDDRALRGYNLDSTTIIIRPEGPACGREAVLAEFELLAKQAEIDGLTVSNLTTVHWCNPQTNPSKRPINKKHHVRTFRLKSESNRNGIKSNNWEIERRAPTDEDVFVVLSEFKVTGMSDFYRTYDDDLTVIRRLGGVMPPVYGYKTTARKKIEDGKCKGRHYKAWRLDFIRKLLTPEHTEISRLFSWCQILDKEPEFIDVSLPKLAEVLGKTHPCMIILQQCLASKKIIATKTNNYLNFIDRVNRLLGTSESEAERCVGALRKAYPLLGTTDLSVLVNTPTMDMWLDYIKLVDRDRERLPTALEKAV